MTAGVAPGERISQEMSLRSGFPTSSGKRQAANFGCVGVEFNCKVYCDGMLYPQSRSGQLCAMATGIDRASSRGRLESA